MYTTLDKVKAELQGTEAYKPLGVDQVLMDIIRRITNRVRRIGYDFEPQYDTKYFTANNNNVSSQWYTLYLKAQLLEVTTMTSESTSLTFGSSTSDIVPWPNGTSTPYDTLRIRNPYGGSAIYTWYPRNPQNAIESVSISGFWGFRTYYAAQGWLLSGSTLATALTDTTTTTISTQSVGGLDPFGNIPRFSPGNLIRIDNEMLEVVGTDTNANTLTVVRGVNGSTAATHTVSSIIKWWSVEPDLQGAVTRQCALWYARRGAYDTVQINDVATVVFPPDLEKQLINTVRYLVGSV